MPQIYTQVEITPTIEDFEKIISAKLSYEQAQTKSEPEKSAWNKANFGLTPWGISYILSKHKQAASIAYAKQRGWSEPKPKTDIALRYFITAIALDWQELIDQLKKTLRLWGYTSEDLQQMAKQVWQTPSSLKQIEQNLTQAQASNNIKLTEDIEKHSTLNSKLFTKEEVLKEKVRTKMLEIVDEFLNNLKEQGIKIKVDDILFIGSNASYNYTKDSDIDLHILANAKAVDYDTEIGNALYSAYRTLFNKQLDIKLFDIPLELFVELEDSQRVSNGIYSVKKDKWLKKPVHESIPDYDKEALGTLVDKWEQKCKKLIDDIKADKLEEETRVVKLLEEIYEKLRKKGVAKSEYSIENLAFKELRNKGYLDDLKNYRNELTSKRLSLEERLDRQTRSNIYNQIAQVTKTPPIIQDNGIFYVYNLKASEINFVLQALRKLPVVKEASAFDNGKYDFSQIATTQLPTKYYDIRGTINT